MSTQIGKDCYEQLCQIYFIEASTVGLVKIGYATDVLKRFNGMLTMSPIPLSLLAAMPGGPRREVEIHAQFEGSRAHGEWFRKTADLDALIASAERQYDPKYYRDRLPLRRGAGLQDYLAKMKAGEVVRPTRGPTRPSKRKTHDRYGNPIEPSPPPTSRKTGMDEVTGDTSKLALVEVVARALAIADGKDPDGPAWVRYPGAHAFGVCWRDQYADKAEAALTAIHESGTHRVVPVEPTEEMLKAEEWEAQFPDDTDEAIKQSWRDEYGKIYRAMLSASPPPV